MAHAADPVVAANDQARVLVQQLMAELKIPGLQLAVVRDGTVLLSEAYGWANVENHVPVTASTLFPINSATKALTGVAVMQLVEAGRLKLDAPMSDYLDDLPPAWRSVKVRQLLAHTSGLPEIVEQPGPTAGGSEVGMWRAVRQQPLQAAPGERFAYNQTNYGLLAQLIAKQARMPFAQFLAERQLAVAGMPLTTWGDSYDLVPQAATIYSHFARRTLAPNDAQRLSRWIYDIPYSLHAGGGLLTTAQEMAAWLAALSQDRLLSLSSRRAMWAQERLNSGAPGPWGAGWPVLAIAPSLQVAGIGGNRAAFIVYPDEDLALVVLTNLVGANPERFIPRIAALYRR
jgi:CubicO group peptidase (beta-lactamase class C family)